MAKYHYDYCISILLGANGEASPKPEKHHRGEGKTAFRLFTRHLQHSIVAPVPRVIQGYVNQLWLTAGNRGLNRPRDI